MSMQTINLADLIDLSVYGIGQVDVGATMWSVKDSVILYTSPEHALEAAGFNVVITMDGVAIEPWG